MKRCTLFFIFASFFCSSFSIAKPTGIEVVCGRIGDNFLLFNRVAKRVWLEAAEGRSLSWFKDLKYADEVEKLLVDSKELTIVDYYPRSEILLADDFKTGGIIVNQPCIRDTSSTCTIHYRLYFNDGIYKIQIPGKTNHTFCKKLLIR